VEFPITRSARRSKANKPMQREARSADVFVVDDEEMVGMLVQEILQARGYQVIFFQDPSAAARAFADADPKPRLILADYVMAPFNGMELIDRCRACHPDVRTILYSGTSEEEIFKRHANRPDHFLSKPFLAKVLLDTVQEHLGESG